MIVGIKWDGYENIVKNGNQVFFTIKIGNDPGVFELVIQMWMVVCTVFWRHRH